MAFSFSNAVTGGGGFGGQAQFSGAVQVKDGPELQEIQTDQLGFSSINGDSRVRILPSAWPIDSLPSPTSSLLSIASSKGFLAAAGPDILILASTENVRNAFHADGGSDGNVKPFQPEVRISVPRLSHVAFSADETVLVISSQEGGGLVAYQVDSLKNGNTEPALQISTNNAALRALIPNPAAESAELIAAVTNNGELLIADLKAGQLKTGPDGPVLKTGVSCLSWSNKGRQLVAGLGDGTAAQMKPDGTIVAQIPKSTSIPESFHLSAISWLENDSFFAVYTPNDTASDGMMPSSGYFIISRQSKTADYTFEKLPEVCPPFGLERLPSFHFINRLRGCRPHLLDLLILTSTTSIDVGLLSKSDAPLSKDEPVVGAFTLTTINDDTRRAQLPLSEFQGDTSAIGVALDLSSKDIVGAPIPSDVEIRETSTPLPSLMILTHEGILVSWWIVYNDSVRQKTMFPGLLSTSRTASGQGQVETSATPVQAPPAASPMVQDTGTFGQSGFGNQSTFGKPAMTSFGTPASPAAFGATSSPVFGTKSTIGGEASSWTSTGFGQDTASKPTNSAFGQPAFGSSTPITNNTATPTAAFGAASSLGNRASPFGQVPTSSAPAFGQTGFGTSTPLGGAQNKAPAFGQTSFGAATPLGATQSKSPFGTAPGTSSSSGFSAFSKADGLSGFAAATKNEGGPSIFAQPASSPFSKAGDSLFAGSKPEGQSIFGSAPAQNKDVFGTGSGGFKIASTFQGDGSAKDDLPRSTESKGSIFGKGNLDALLGGSNNNALSPTHDTEAEMDEKDHEEQSDSQDEADQKKSNNMPTDLGPPQPMVTPPSTIIQHKTTPAPPLSSLFGSSNLDKTTTPIASQTAGSGFSFGALPSTTPKDTPGPAHKSIFGNATASGPPPSTTTQNQPGRLFTQASSFQPNKVVSSAVQSPQSEEPPKVKTEPLSDDEKIDIHSIPKSPLPPNPSSKTVYSPGDTSSSSNNSKAADDAPLPPDFLPANRSVGQAFDPPELPEDEEEEEFSSDFEGSGEDVTDEISPIEEHAADHSEHLLTSPESSFGRGGEKSNDESPTGGIFTKVTSTHPKKGIPRALFGEVDGGPLFPPPKPQESPRSPSPIRHLPHSDLLRPDGPRSFSAPQRPPALEEKKRELAKSAMALQAAREREEKKALEQARADAILRAQAQAEAEAAQALEDDEDERLRTELNEPVEPCAKLEGFLPHQPASTEEISKSGIPGQTERLYQDINSMVITLGINARSLSAFMLYQETQEDYDAVPNALKSATPIDALNQEWLLADIVSLQAGEAVLNRSLDINKPSDAASKLQKCHALLGKEIFDLRSKLMILRKAFHVRSDPSLIVTAPLSPEQASTQQGIRKAATAVQMKLSQAEENLSILRAKLAELAPAHEQVSSAAGRRLGRSGSQKKPTVEAVTNTIAKMTSMAEKKSADIDILEAQLKRLNVSLGESVNGSRQGSTEPNGTLQKSRASPFGRSTSSATTSVYHTPDSKFSGSFRSTPATGRKGLRSSTNGAASVLSTEDLERWKMKAQRKQEIATMMREALAKKRTKA